jgi:hypothetical protein
MTALSRRRQQQQQHRSDNSDTSHYHGQQQQQPTLPLTVSIRDGYSQQGVGEHNQEILGDPLSPSSVNSQGPRSPNQPTRQQRRKRRKKSSRFLNDFIIHPSTMTGVFPYLLLVVVVFLYVATSMYMFLPASSPHIPVANVDVPVPNVLDWPIIHIVNTRFMQEQGPLTILGMARFHLFMTFCFPTMVAQSSQHFFWIIKTDPQFTKTPVFDLMLQAIQSAQNHNIYLVASNNNFLITPQTRGSWKDGAECKDLLQSQIYTGNITNLHMAMALRNELPVVETRLDADDGLHMHYLKYIQIMALKRFQPAVYHAWQRQRRGEEDASLNETELAQLPPAPQWLYWCTRRHLEWHTSMKGKNGTQQNNSSVGVLAPIRHDKLCVTPGMTVGYNVDVDSSTVPFHSHDTLFQAVSKSSDCYPTTAVHHVNKTAGEKQPACLDLVEDLLFCALRSRTMTSAGMLNVNHIPAFKMNQNITIKLWQLLDERFSIKKTRVQRTQEFLMRHQKEIAYENILGQCTTGHSCKDQAKAELQRIIDEENGTNSTL